MQKEYQLEYNELLAEEEVNIKDLPTPLRKKINTLNMQYSRFNKSTPTEKMRKMIIKNDLHIFLPKSLTNIIEISNGNVQVEIPQWLINQKELQNYAL